MNTFLEKVTRSPKAASRSAAAFFIRTGRSAAAARMLWTSGDMAEHMVRGMVGDKLREIGRRVDVACEARPAHEHRLDARRAGPFAMQCGAGSIGREGER